MSLTAKLLGAVGSIVAISAMGAVASCSRTADPVPLRTFDRAQNIDVVCMRVLKDDGTTLVPPVPLAQGECAANPPSVSGGFLPNHLFALVTQTARGEVAVVDLTGGRIVDTDHSTPGVNFLPVGTLPTDIASSPDGKITFTIKQDGPQVLAEVDTETSSTEKAQEIERKFAGMLWLGAKTRSDKPEGLLMTNTKVSSDGNKVIFKLSMAHEEVVKIVEKGMEITPSPTPLD